MAKKKDVTADSIYFDELVEFTENPWASKVVDGIQAGDVSGYVDTGSYILNALVSASIYKGIPKGRVTVLAGPESTAKTFILLESISNFLKAEERGAAIIFTTESSITADMFKDHKIDQGRSYICPVITVQHVRTQMSRILTKYLMNEPEKRRPLFLGCDSLGNLATQEEMDKAEEGSDKEDMKRAKLIRSLFRVVTTKLGLAQVPFVCSNHTYADPINPYGGKKQSGGGGILYNNSSSVFLSRKKEKEGDEVVGNVIHCKNEKSRLSKENATCDIMVRYDRGLERYYGLVELAEKHGVFIKEGKKYKLPNGVVASEKEINRNPETYYTKEVLDAVDEAAKKEYSYGVVKQSIADKLLEEDDDEQLV